MKSINRLNFTLSLMSSTSNWTVQDIPQQRYGDNADNSEPQPQPTSYIQVFATIPCTTVMLPAQR